MPTQETPNAGAGQPATAMQRMLADPVSGRLLTRQRRLRRSIEEERARLGASCGDMSPAIINDTSLRLARMEVLVEELDYAMDAMAEGGSLQQAAAKATERLLNDAGPLGDMTIEVQRARFAGLAEAVRILRDEMA